MKRNIRLALIGAATLFSLGLTACTDPTELPKSSVAPDIVFKDPSAYQAFLAKIYAGMATTGQQGPAGNKDISTINDEGFSQYIRLYWEHQELPTDEAALAWNDGPVQEFNSQIWGSSNAFLGAMFARVFLQVTWVNEFLKETEDAKLSERGHNDANLRTQIQGFRAEARFLRALAYWHGVDIFGPIPVVTVNDPTPPQQNTRTEVYNFIVSELIAILPELPSAGPGFYGRATKEAAHMLLAKVYMNAEVYTGSPHYAEAMTEIQAVIAGPYSLAASYRNNFQADNHTSPEIIFPVVEDGIHTQSYGGVNFLIHASCGGSMSNSTYGVDGCWWGLRLKPEAYNMVSGDPRHSGYLYTTGQNVQIASLTNFNDGIAAPKYTNITSGGSAGSNVAFADTDFPMFRLADAYLMYAEVHLRGGGGTAQQALDYVNAIRQRAYGDTSGDITAPELTLSFILDERGRELLWEGHRRTDLVRYGLFTGGTYIWAWKGNVQAGQATQAHLNLYPIPATQLSANPNLHQNPGY
jgi:hypothetical protein